MTLLKAPATSKTITAILQNLDSTDPAQKIDYLSSHLLLFQDDERD